MTSPHPPRRVGSRRPSVLAGTVLLAIQGYNPDPSGIPGAGTFITITNWVAFMAEVGCLFGFVAGVATAVVGRVTGNSLVAGVGVLVSVPCLLGAVLIPNAGTIVNAFLNLQLK
jgi:hypothetical protein